MYFLEGAPEVLKTIILLVADEYEVSGDVETASLRDKYIEFCVSVGGEELRPPDHDVQFCFNDERINKLVSKYTDYSQLTDINADLDDTPIDVRKEAMGAILSGKDKLREIDETLHGLFEFMIHTMFYHRSKRTGGGSVTSAPGQIWCAHRRNWSDWDIAEFLVHELTHNIVFLDERRYVHYINFDDIAKAENYVASAVLNRDRPLDKVIHSLVVAHEVLRFREIAGEPLLPKVHPDSLTMLSNAMRSLKEAKSTVGSKLLVTDRVHNILDKLELSFGAMSLRHDSEQQKGIIA